MTQPCRQQSTTNVTSQSSCSRQQSSLCLLLRSAVAVSLPPPRAGLLGMVCTHDDYTCSLFIALSHSSCYLNLLQLPQLS